MRVLLKLGIALAAVRLFAADTAAAETPPPRTGEYTRIEPAEDTEIELGFKTSRGIVLYFKGNHEPKRDSHAQFYLCPVQDVQAVGECFELMTGGQSRSSHSAAGVDNLWQTFREAGDKSAELEFDVDTETAKLTCPADKPEDIQRLTEAEIELLNGRITSGEIKLMELPDVAGDIETNSIKIFELQDGRTLVIVHSGTHWGRASNTFVRGYLGHPGAMSEVGVTYDKPSYGYIIDGLGILNMRGREKPVLNGTEEVKSWVERSDVKAVIKDLGLDEIFKHAPVKTLCGPVGPVS